MPVEDGKPDLGAVAHAVELRLGDEYPPDRDSVDAADQGAILPDLDRMGISGFVRALIERANAPRDPGQRHSPEARIAAAIDDVHERPIEGDREFLGAKQPARRFL